jgi:hypothetical protein
MVETSFREIRWLSVSQAEVGSIHQVNLYDLDGTRNDCWMFDKRIVMWVATRVEVADLALRLIQTKTTFYATGRVECLAVMQVTG